MRRLWGGRFESGPSEVFERFSGSLHFDQRLFDADIRGSQAFARALEGVGILTSEERGRIVDAFEEIRREPDFSGATDEDEAQPRHDPAHRWRFGGLQDGDRRGDQHRPGESDARQPSQQR